MDNQEQENKLPEIDRKETIINLKKTIKKLQLTLEKINQSEIEEFPTIEITNTFIESSNNLIDNIKLTPRFKVQNNPDNISENVVSNIPPRKKTFNFNFRLGAIAQRHFVIALGSIIIIIGICWTLINPTIETKSNQENIAIITTENPPDNPQPPIIDNSSSPLKEENITNSEITIINDKLETETPPEANLPQEETPEISPPVSIDDNPPAPEEINPPIPEKEVEIIIEEKTVSALTIEQTLYDNIQEQIDQITDKYGKSLIINLRANFRNNYLLITLTQNWYQMNSNEQDNFVNDVYDIGKLLYFNKINFQDEQKNIVARNAVIGDKVIITQR
ncbi:MAG: hypothetical protein ACXITR_14040 [Cyanobacterium sp.]